MRYTNYLRFSFKKIIFAATLLFCYTVNFSQNITVDFEGKVSNDNVILGEVIVQVLQNGVLLTSFKTESDGSYNIYLPLGHDYLISISKNNYVQKYYSVSTKGIPEDQANVKLPTISADVDLFKYYDGVDYSLFNEPINKFFYNAKKSNFDYDKDYLKEKKAAMKLVKLAEKKAILLALEKNEAKQKELEASSDKKEVAAKLVAEKKQLDEKLVKQSLLLKLIEEDEKPLFKGNHAKKEVELNIVAANSKSSEKVIDKKATELIAKHKEVVTEEKQTGTGVIIIKRVVVREQSMWVYEKKIFDWGGVAYFRDKQPITASTFNMETSGKN